jgi:nucleoside-diphosphate-sugar epimerase
MKVLITGAAGFIGKQVFRSVAMRGWEPIGAANLNGTTEREGLIAVDITRPESFNVIRSLGPFDAVVHCAGLAHRSHNIPVAEFEQVNVSGTQNVARLAVELGAKQIVHLSSVMVYGRHGNDISESEECHPKDAYALSKLKGEDALINVSSASGLRATVLRPAPVIGEGCKGNFARLIRAIDRGRFIHVGKGSNFKSMIYVGDVAEACVRLLEEKNSDDVEVFNLAAPSVTTNELLGLVSESLGKRRFRFTLPAEPIRTALRKFADLTSIAPLVSVASSLETWVAEDVYSAVSIQERYGFETQTSIAEAVRKTVAAYRSESAI